jgi:hypothetical protein
VLKSRSRLVHSTDTNHRVTKSVNLSVWFTAAFVLLVSATAPAQGGPIRWSSGSPTPQAEHPGADPLFHLTFSGNGISGSVFLNATDEGNGTFQATSGTGSVTGPANSGVLTLFTNPTPNQTFTYSTSGFFIYNDRFFTGPNQLLDLYGLLFTLPNGTEVNLFNNGSSINPQYLYYDNSGFNVPVQFTVSAVPEPASLTLVGVSFLGLCGYTLRRARNRSALEK